MTKDLETLYLSILKKGLSPVAKEDNGTYTIYLQLPNGQTVDTVTLVPNTFLNALSFPHNAGFTTFFSRLKNNDTKDQISVHIPQIPTRG
jgi:hypothetical protein